MAIKMISYGFHCEACHKQFTVDTDKWHPSDAEPVECSFCGYECEVVIDVDAQHVPDDMLAFGGMGHVQ